MEILVKGAHDLGLGLQDGQLDQFQTYLQELVEWNQAVNLTAIIDPVEVETRHFLDSLTVALAVSPGDLADASLVDVGSGAGFPGLPLKIAWPGLKLTLVESVGKKARFLRHVRDTLGLADVDVTSERAETLGRAPGLRESFDVVVARAVAELNILVELTLPLCRIGGTVVAMKKADVEDELHRAERAIELLGGSPARVVVVDVPELGERRWLVVIEKTSPTPPAYPRRPGMPGKRPL